MSSNILELIISNTCRHLKVDNLINKESLRHYKFGMSHLGTVTQVSMSSSSFLFCLIVAVDIGKTKTTNTTFHQATRLNNI